ncbi:DUF3617 family protein [Phenylobacterium sp.]|uniref:DUF3617 domain-containing protein n=1 Tax=Phenylobacterium sp. TaxID=1871053 RepID=UPI0025D62578|nr:DUF3617 family protein [Phenylobacterium sp.]MBX3486224.1 DUF3617 family protein [Phenylobacterium sp.]MCW5760187.1 DUF3617 family protein [Phenylobacterium sp.]
MKAPTALLAPALALALAAPAAHAAATITPGYWESTNRLLSPIRQSKTEKRCITPAEVDKFLSGPSNRHYACTYPTRVFAGGQIRLKGTCVSKKGRKVAVQGTGSYSPDSFSLTAEIATEFLGLDVVGKASTEARRIGDACPSPAEIEAQNRAGQ